MVTKGQGIARLSPSIIFISDILKLFLKRSVTVVPFPYLMLASMMSGDRHKVMSKPPTHHNTINGDKTMNTRSNQVGISFRFVITDFLVTTAATFLF